MKRILITAGPTNEYIDEVMKITNMSTGKLGLELAKTFCSSGECNVTLIGNRNISPALHDQTVFTADKFRFVPVETTADMYTALENEASEVYDAVIHSAAVGDYKPEFTFRLEDAASAIVAQIQNCMDNNKAITYSDILDTMTSCTYRVNSDTKISSYEPHLTVKLTLTPKLISNLKSWFPKSVLIGFKLLNNVSKDHLISVATKLCKKNQMDYILANDLAELRKDSGSRHVVTKTGATGVSLKTHTEIAQFVLSVI